VRLTERANDHLFGPDWVYRIMRQLTCARSVTARIFTAREGGEQHLPGRKFSPGAPGTHNRNEGDPETEDPNVRDLRNALNSPDASSRIGGYQRSWAYNLMRSTVCS
jgi:hypothetical protein